MEDSEILESVSEIVSLAGEGIAAAIAQAAADGDAEATLDACLGNIETIAMAAEMMQLEGIQQVCTAVSRHLRSLNGSTAAYVNEYGPHLCTWGDAVLTYIRRPNDPRAAEDLLAPLPEGRRASLLVNLQGPGVTTLQTTDRQRAATDTREPTSGSAAEPGESELAFRLATATSPSDSGIALATDVGNSVKRDESAEPEKSDSSLSEVAQQLAEPLAELVRSVDALTLPEANKADLGSAIDDYNDILNRVISASEVIGLSGLSAACSFVRENANALPGLEPLARAAAREVFKQWPLEVLSYVDDPTSEVRCTAVVNHLTLPAWPQPLKEAQVPELLALLTPDPDEYLGESEERQTLAQPGDVELIIADDINPRLVEAFLQESPGTAAEFSDRIARIVRGEEIGKNVGTAQRLAHNLKGSANLIGVKGIANLTHHLEDILEYLSIREIVPQQDLAHTLQESADCVEAMLDALQGLAEPPGNTQRILQDVLDWANRADGGQLEAAPRAPVVEAATHLAIEPPIHPPARESTSAEILVTERPDTGIVAENAPASQPTPVIREKSLQIPLSTVDEMFSMVGELSIAIDQLKERFRSVQRQSNEMRGQERIIQQRRFELENFVDVRHIATMQQRFHRIGSSREMFDPLELNEYDELYSATRTFIETVSDSRRMLLQLRGELSSVERMFTQLQRMKQGLQETVMRTRMEPVSTISARLQRSVRQAARATGKQVELTIGGVDALLDSAVLDKIVDPLMHMLRNAVDHGLESMEERAAQGKTPTGTVELQFFQEGHNMIINCTDDGRGLDYERIRETATRKGIIAATESTDKPTLARMILAPGFTTRTTATQISGRGVGLDVVNAAVTDLKGIMEVGDNQPTGCRITLRLPLTLMTSYCLVVEVAGQRYAIPSSSVARVLAPKVGQFRRLGKEAAYEVGNEIFQAKSLASCLNIGGIDDAGSLFQKAALLVHSDTGLVAVAIDRVVDSYHLVIKSLGRHVKAVHGIAGVSSLADGSLIPVLNPTEILRTSVRLTAEAHPPQADSFTAPAAAELSVPQVLIVDDSLSVRQSLAELMGEAGYNPLLARDGVEAVDILRKQSPDVVLSDIEMPRMNGLELASYIRTTHSETLPIVMITSRTMQKHRQQAKQVGVDLYLTKPFAEDELLKGIHSLLQ